MYNDIKQTHAFIRGKSAFSFLFSLLFYWQTTRAYSVSLLYLYGIHNAICRPTDLLVRTEEAHPRAVIRTLDSQSRGRDTVMRLCMVTIACQSEWRWSRVRIPALRAYRVQRHTTPENLANDVWVLLKIILFGTLPASGQVLSFPVKYWGSGPFLHRSGSDFSKCQTKMPFVSKNP